MDFTITIADNELQDFQDAFSKAYGYQPEVSDEKGNVLKNDVSPLDFAIAKVQAFAEEVIDGFISNRNFDAARAATNADKQKRTTSRSPVVLVKPGVVVKPAPTLNEPETVAGGVIK